MSVPICVVIGATGYLSVHIVEQLLSRGFVVHATVRDVVSPGEALISLLEEFSTLKLFQATLDDLTTFVPAFKDASYIFHTAAPVPSSYAGKDGGLDPNAVKYIVTGAGGIVDVAVKSSKMLKRVIFTSSASALRAIGSTSPPGDKTMFDEDCWNTVSDISLGNAHVYGFMKAESERAFWATIDKYPSISGAAICPGFIIGPPKMDRSSLSISWMKQWLTTGGSTTPQCFTDVRDCAKAHIEAALREEAKNQRYVVVGDRAIGGEDILSVVKKSFPDADFSWTLSDPCASTSTASVSTFNNLKARREIGYNPREWKDSLIDGLRTLINLKAIDYKIPLSFPPVVVVIGGCGGIGGGTVEAFIEAGCEVHATGAFEKEVEVFKSRHPNVSCDILDICDHPAVEAYAAKFSKCDTLVNAGGINMRNGKEFDIANFSKVLSVNLTGMMSTCTAFKSLLAASPSASIVNIASMNSFFGSGKIPAYSSSKGGVVSLTKSLALAYAGDGIRVNAVAPGYIITPLTTAHTTNKDVYDAVVNRTPMGRWGKPKDIADPIVYLASAKAAYITGATLPVDGGLLVCGPV